MNTFNKVSHHEALELIRHSVAASADMGKHIAISVAGPEGELLAFLRMDGAAPASALIAQNKAYTAARDRKSTREMGIFMEDANRPPAFWGDLGITGFGGGVSIIVSGAVIGGLGISGLTEEQDEQIARTAISKVYK